MNIPDLDAFIAVVETGSIGGAARRLNLTQPGVTRRVQALEQTLGTALLDRRSKPPRSRDANRGRGHRTPTIHEAETHFALAGLLPRRGHICIVIADIDGP